MDAVVVAHNALGGGPFFVFLPFMLVGAAVWFITVAVRDKGGRRGESLRKVPSELEHPLRYFYSAITAPRRATRRAARAERTIERKLQSRPPWSKH